jgi:hypothetical protein
MGKARISKEESDKGWSLDPRMVQVELLHVLSLMSLLESEAFLGNN